MMGLIGCIVFPICPFHENLSVLSEIQFLRKNVTPYIHVRLQKSDLTLTQIYFSLENPILLKP